MVRNTTLDTVKGILIISVILVHIISKGPLTQYLGYFITSFHMQLFFGVSGYLLSDNLFEKSLKELIIKYWYRLIIPFLFAYFLYCMIKQEWLGLFFPYPWFHLWFIVAFILMIVFVYFMEKFKVNKTILLMLSFFYTIFWIGTYGSNGLVDVYYWMGHKAIYYDFVFFYLGYYLRNNSELLNEKYWFVWLIFIGGAINIWVVHSSEQKNYIYSSIWTLFNMSIIYLTLWAAQKVSTIKLSLVTWMGTMSLSIYLLHIIPLILLNPFVEDGSLTLYMNIISYFIGVVLIMYLIYIVKDTRFGKIFILGERIASKRLKK